MDEEARCRRIADIAARRAQEATARLDEKRRWECAACGSKHASYNAHVEHELCEKCREAAFTRMREQRVCCRCDTPVETLTPAGVRDDRKGRFIICLRCALIIPTDPEDRVTGASVEYGPR